MRCKLLTLCILTSSIASFSQSNTPNNNATKPAAPLGTPRATPTVPTTYITDNLNAIVTYEPQLPYTTEADVVSINHSVNEVRRSTLYFDGLGYQIQGVEWQMSSDKRDIVSINEYDQSGRETYKYLPFASTTLANVTVKMGNGNFKTSPYDQQAKFYSTQYNGENVFYSHDVYEASPLDRVLKSFAPGNSWAGSEGAPTERSVQRQYLINDAADIVHKWSIAINPSDPTSTKPSDQGLYTPGELFKNVSINENSIQTIEYKDKEGKIVLKKTQADNTPSSFYDGWLCTYYVYDDFGLLRFVITPKLVAKMNNQNSWSITNAKAAELCFHYEYDARHRMSAKKVPGAAWVYMLYDDRDRLVFTQDGNLGLKNQWMITCYDPVNRPILTGILKNTTNTTISAAALQSTLDQLDFTTSQTIDGMIVNTNPVPAGMTVISLTKTYYKTYDWTTTSYNSIYNTQFSQAILNLTGEANPVSPNNILEGLVTGTQVRVIKNPDDISAVENNVWLTTVNFYDAKGRTIQSNTTNYKGGSDITANLYDFNGKLLSTYIGHSNPTYGTIGIGIGTDIQFDHAGRILKVKKRIYNQMTPSTGVNPIVVTKILDNVYTPLGQLLTKELGQEKDASSGNYTSTIPIETLDYEYNIRGWLKSINKDYSNINGSATDRWFGMELSYDWGFQKKEYSGNISGVTWRSKGDGARRSYGFWYDNVNRLMDADFNQLNGSIWDKTSQIDFSLKMGDGLNYRQAYDENGNILRMQQWGVKIGSTSSASAQIDDLIYSYYNNDNSNKLQTVTDQITADNKLGDFYDKNIVGDDYGYDVNGNLITDKNKSLDGAAGIDQIAVGAIKYTYQSLPWNITVQKNADVTNDNGSTIKGTIKYIYDAVGTKLEKVVSENASSANGHILKTVTTTYLGGFTYEQTVAHNNATNQDIPSTTDGLQYIAQEEGRIRRVDDGTGTGSYKYSYDYFIKDHLGNIRMVLTDELKEDIYPAATLENNAAALNIEKQYYYITNDAATIVDESTIPSFDGVSINQYKNNNQDAANGGYVNPNPSANTGQNSNRLYKLNGNTGLKTGLGITLKVMSGDQVKIMGKSYYHLNSGQSPSNSYLINTALTDFISVFTGSSTVVGNKLGVTPTTILNSIPDASTQLGSFLNQPSRVTGTLPVKGAINWILFDEQFKPVISNSGFYPLGGSDQLVTYNNAPVNVTKNGYLYVYCSNESNVDVFFDNLQLVHIRGPLVEETHYYPFGLTMNSISSKALGFGDPINKKRYNGIEKIGNFDLEDYEAQFRDLDPQIGRWWQIDPKIEDMESWSPYVSNFDNPVLLSDPLGDWPDIDLMIKVHHQLKQASAFFTGALNAYSSDNLGGIGRVDGTNLVGKKGAAFQMGQKFGDAGAIVTGSGEVGGSITAEVATDGAATLVGAGELFIHGGTTVVTAAKNIFTPIVYVKGGKEATDKGKVGEKATNSDLPKDKTSFTSPSDPSKERTPDKTTIKTIQETKNVVYQYFSTQLKDYKQIAENTGRKFILWLRSDTKVSKPLEQEFKNGNIKRKTIPGT